MKKGEFVHQLIELLQEATNGCNIQYGGCPCKTCFYELCDRLGLSDKRATNFWRVVLALRGDYSEEELANADKAD